MLARRLVARNILLRWRGRHDLADSIQGHIVQRPEPQAGPTHIKLLASHDEGFLQSRFLVRVRICSHEVQGIIVFLGSEGEVPKRLTVVGGGVARQRDLVANLAPAHGFLITSGQVAQNHAPHGGNNGAALVRQVVQILLDRRRRDARHAILLGS